MSTALDLSRYHFRRRKGDLTVLGTWLRTDEDWRPCLAIVRTGEEADDRTVPCVITIDKAWIWTEEVGDIVIAAHTTAGFLDALRMTPDNRNILRILSIVRDSLGDLVTMPPFQAHETYVAAEITVRAPDGSVKEAEVVEDV